MRGIAIREELTNEWQEGVVYIQARTPREDFEVGEYL